MPTNWQYLHILFQVFNNTNSIENFGFNKPNFIFKYIAYVFHSSVRLF